MPLLQEGEDEYKEEEQESNVVSMFVPFVVYCDDCFFSSCGRTSWKTNDNFYSYA